MTINPIVRQSLDLAVSQIESAFPGVVAAYESFFKPRMGTSPDEIRLEVFNLESAHWGHFQELVLDIEDVFFAQTGISLSILGWTQKETLASFQEDLAAVMRHREIGKSMTA